MKTETIRYEIDQEGIVTLTMDDPTQSANTMRGQFVEDYDAVTRHIEANKGDIKGAQELLLRNGRYLQENGAKYNSAVLLQRGVDNRDQAGKLLGPEWAKNRKVMRRLQYADGTQQGY